MSEFDGLMARLRADSVLCEIEAGRSFTQGDVETFLERATMEAEAIDAITTLQARVKELEGDVAYCEEAMADKRRLAREIDVAMHGEEGAAKQASLCDLVWSAKQLRARATRAEARVAEAEPEGWKLVPLVATKHMEAAARTKVKPYHDLSDYDLNAKVPGDLFKLAWPAMLAAAPLPSTENAAVAEHLSEVGPNAEPQVNPVPVEHRQ